MGGLKIGSSNPPNIKQMLSINPIFTSSIKKITEKNNNAMRASIESHGATHITDSLENAFQENNQHNSFHLP